MTVPGMPVKSTPPTRFSKRRVRDQTTAQQSQLRFNQKSRAPDQAVPSPAAEPARKRRKLEAQSEHPLTPAASFEKQKTAAQGDLRQERKRKSAASGQETQPLKKAKLTRSNLQSFQREAPKTLPPVLNEVGVFCVQYGGPRALLKRKVVEGYH